MKRLFIIMLLVLIAFSSSVFSVGTTDRITDENEKCKVVNRLDGSKSFNTPFNVHTGDLLMKAECMDNGMVKIKLGNQESSDAFFKKGRYYGIDKSWKHINYSLANFGKQKWESDRFVSSGEIILDPKDLKKDNYVISYICSLNPDVDQRVWSCGCQEENCTSPRRWSILKFTYESKRTFDDDRSNDSGRDGNERNETKRNETGSDQDDKDCDCDNNNFEEKKRIFMGEGEITELQLGNKTYYLSFDSFYNSSRVQNFMINNKNYGDLNFYADSVIFQRFGDIWVKPLGMLISDRPNVKGWIDLAVGNYKFDLNREDFGDKRGDFGNKTCWTGTLHNKFDYINYIIGSDPGDNKIKIKQDYCRGRDVVVSHECDQNDRIKEYDFSCSKVDSICSKGRCVTCGIENYGMGVIALGDFESTNAAYDGTDVFYNFTMIEIGDKWVNMSVNGENVYLEEGCGIKKNVGNISLILTDTILSYRDSVKSYAEFYFEPIR